jgi:4,5-DOPA dioxygenase extradiol
MNTLLPTLFLSHGAPTLALENGATSNVLRGLAATLPVVPHAIIVASAHWETEIPMITGAEQPETIHDFHGFPEELNAMQYKVPGNPALAKQMQILLKEAGIVAGIDPVRGLDHGAWGALVLSFPAGAIPVIQISVQSRQDARWHYRIGQALAPLRDDKVLIIGSGNLTHNLREAMRGNYDNTPPWVSAFAEWVTERTAHGDVESLLDWQKQAPFARENHPTPEHFLPFFVALGAAGVPLHARRLHDNTTFGVLAMDAYAFTD